MADDVVRLDPARAHRGKYRQRRRDEGRLLHGRVDEVVGVAVEAEMLEVEPGRRAAARVHVHGAGHGLGDVAAHAGLDRALAGEAERNLRHAAISFVQRIRADPHVSPAPMPVISTSSPGRSRPSAAASARASGIEPDDVLP